MRASGNPDRRLDHKFPQIAKKSAALEMPGKLLG